MRAGESHISNGRGRAIVALALVAMLGVALIPTVASGKKKKKPRDFATKSLSAGLSSGNTDQLTTGCDKKFHATGGGYTVVPSFTPPASGTRTSAGVSSPSGVTAWTASDTAYTVPSVAGTFTAFVRCEKNSFAKALQVLSGTSTLAVGEGANLVINCPPGTHALNGGYSTSGPPVPSNPAKLGAEIFDSRRTGISQWTVHAINPSPDGVGPQAVTGYATCEKGGRAISEVSSTVPIFNDSRMAADPACGKGQHAVSGGFSIAPSTPSAIPTVSMDENQPVGQSAWHFGLYELPTFALPAGSTLTGTAYCRSNKPPKLKKHK